jgi:hypothetical protein
MFTAAGNCSVTGNTVHLISAGNCTITAAQGGGGNYLPATSVSQSFTITSAFVISDFTTLSQQGSVPNIPMATASTLTLSTDTSQTSAAWYPAKQTVGNGFTTQFTFSISAINGGQVADGFAFVIQNSPAGTSALGTTGQGGFIGYQGLTNSLAVEFDTFQNSWDPNANHVAIQSNGMAANSSDHTSAALLAINAGIANLSDGATHAVKITYDGNSTLLVYLDGNLVLTGSSVNLGNLGLDPGGNAVVGFTAATGASRETTSILSWSYSSN